MHINKSCAKAHLSWPSLVRLRHMFPSCFRVLIIELSGWKLEMPRLAYITAKFNDAVHTAVAVLVVCDHDKHKWKDYNGGFYILLHKEMFSKWTFATF